MNGFPWFKFFASDFLTDPETQDLSLPARGLYVSCKAAQWRRGWLPSDLDHLARTIGADPAEVRQYWPEVEARYQRVTTEKGLVMFEPDLEEERQAAIESAEKQSHAGRIGGVASGKARRRKAQASQRTNEPFNDLRADRSTTAERMVERSSNDRGTESEPESEPEKEVGNGRKVRQEENILPSRLRALAHGRDTELPPKGSEDGVAGEPQLPVSLARAATPS